MNAELAADIARLRLVVFDFDGVFTDNTVYVFEDGREAVRCWRGDGLGLDRIRRLGIECLILSTETNPVVGARARKLRIPCVQGAGDKLAALEDILAERGIDAAEVAYVGNDVNDAGCLSHVGVPLTVADAHQGVAALSRYCTAAAGGQGAVREICDLIAEVREKADAR